MVEFRLYFDDKGDVLCYSCENLDGNYLVIDAQTYAECRFDIRVVDNQIVKLVNKINILKVVPSSTGIMCPVEDNAIIVDEAYDGEITRWKTKIYEL